MRLVLDTNVVISAMLWGGIPKQFLCAAVLGQHELCTCEALLIELLTVLQRKKFSAQLARIHTDARQLSNHYRRLSKSVPVPLQIPKICRDPMDDIVLACAHAAHADAIVSGDKDLLSLGYYGLIPILRASHAILIL